MSLYIRCVSIFLMTMLYAGVTSACELCTVPRIGKHKAIGEDSWFAEYHFEIQNWKEIDPHEAHELHHEGHHVHDKTKEYIHHYSLGKKVTDDLTVIADLPYVIRKSLEIHDHDTLGNELRSQGLGDLHVMGLYQLWDSNDARTVSAVGGIKFPTGETDETTPDGELFEAELQPGSGSFDYIMGALFTQKRERFDLTSNLLYVLKTEGDHDYEFGDTVITSLLWQYLIPVSAETVLKVGIDGTLQYEMKHEDDGGDVEDSGGTTLLLGPSATLEINEVASVFGQIQFPAVQKLGGEHQEVESVFNAGVKVNW